MVRGLNSIRMDMDLALILQAHKNPRFRFRPVGDGARGLGQPIGEGIRQHFARIRRATIRWRIVRIRQCRSGFVWIKPLHVILNGGFALKPLKV
jgi:hypothetical protein